MRMQYAVFDQENIFSQVIEQKYPQNHICNYIYNFKSLVDVFLKVEKYAWAFFFYTSIYLSIILDLLKN